jgi:hypothetical protein
MRVSSHEVDIESCRFRPVDCQDVDEVSENRDLISHFGCKYEIICKGPTSPELTTNLLTGRSHIILVTDKFKV